MPRAPLARYAWLSIGASLATIALKVGAYELTLSVGLLSDAVESLVNLAGGVMALLMLRIAARPEDAEHAYGHGKAEYFSSGIEGALVVLAAGGIAWAAVGRLLTPQPLEGLAAGLVVSGSAAVINLAVALVLLRVGKARRSITLEANAHHLLTDVWTSAGVIGALVAVGLTGWAWLDAAVALAVAANIVRTGVSILRRSVAGLMDEALPAEDVARVQAVLSGYGARGVQFHGLRTRQAGARRFISFDVLVPGEWTVQRGHDLLEEIEAAVRQSVPDAAVFTHLEPIEDPASFADQTLDRPQAGASS